VLDPGRLREVLESNSVAETDIAVVGMAGRFPGARTPGELWANVRNGVESIRRLSDAELRAAGIDDATLGDARYVKACAPLDDMELFDAGFFGFSPKEASILDPQHRHFLECAWEALESAGHPPERFPGSIGVFAGCGMNAYFVFNLLSNPDLVKSVGLFLLRHTGNDKDFLATRVSYLFNLTGPSLSIQTACSTSLVAIHVASQHLLNGECDLALAGGVTIELPHRVGYSYEEGEILSPDGHCRAFDAESQGTVFGSGVGVVALRRLADALESGDVIHAVIKGSAVNNDGGAKVGYLAPSVDGQAASILEALSVAGTSADQIGYIETHGTGTPVGDPIEVAALTQAFRQHTRRSGFCAIGSLKTNIGHLDTAAGVASFIKAACAVRDGELPPSLHFNAPNPAIEFDATPFYVNAALGPWPPSARPRRAGVSSLGVGGTNAHVVVEEPPQRPASDVAKSKSLLVWSARTSNALDALTERYQAHLLDHAQMTLADVAYTLAVGRRAFGERRALVADDAVDAAAALMARDARRLITGTAWKGAPSVVMLFPGGGAQYPRMGLDLYREEPRFRDELNRCFAVASRLGYEQLQSLIFPDDARVEAASRELERPLHAVLSVFVIEYALAQLWISWGIRPAACLGHSLGEYVAAVLAGVMSLEDAIALVAKRGELFERLPAGAMLSVPLSESEVRELSDATGLSVAALNAPELSVLSGGIGAISAAETLLASRSVEARRLHISVAAHSTMIDAIVEEFRAFVATIRLSPPTLPFVSNVTGTWAGAEVATAEYWARHLRSTVRFTDGLATLLAEPGRVFLEVGPGQTLTSLARLHRADGGPPHAIASLRHPQDAASDLQTVYEALGRLWIDGCEPDWKGFYTGQARRRVELPTYAFDHQRHWIEPGTIVSRQTPAPVERRAPSALDRLGDPADWTRVARWKPLPAAVNSRQGQRRWLVFSNGAPTASSLIEALEHAGHSVLVASPGDGLERVSPSRFIVRGASRDDCRGLLAELERDELRPDRIVHAWLTEGSDAAPEEPAEERILTRQTLGFDTLLALVQGVTEELPDSALEIITLTAGLFPIRGERGHHPDRATVVGPTLVAPREYPTLRCRAIDLPAEGEITAEHLVSELGRQDAPPVVALRTNGAWAPVFERKRLPAVASVPALKAGGTYLITGGFGGIGLALAGFLAKHYHANVGLVGRSRVDRTGIAQSLERDGGQVMTLVADVTDPVAMEAAVAALEARFGAINGVIHAAGTLDDAPIALKTLESARSVLAPKVVGASVLDRIFANRPLDFMALCSSTSASLGLAGQVDYTAANAFLDAFACQRQLAGRGRTIAIDWGIWSDVGVASRLAATTLSRQPSLPSPAEPAAAAPSTLRALFEHLVERGIKAEEGAALFERVLQSNLGPQVLVSPVDYDEVAAAVESISPRGARVASASAARERAADGIPLDPVEAAIAEGFQELLGVGHVMPDQDFFALGGHSLLAVRLINRLEKRFHAGLRVSSVFDAPTIRQLADLVRACADTRRASSPAGSVAAPPGLSSHASEAAQPPQLVAVSRETFRMNRESLPTDDEEDY
jgi:acyl transferase domain-containing protein